MASLPEKIDNDDRFFDSVIVSQGFAEYLRDYDFVIDVPAALPPGVPIGDTVGSYFEGSYRYRFTHCVEAHVTTSIEETIWRFSWDDILIDYEEWEAAGNPEGRVWGVNQDDAYPGWSYVADSPAAASWTQKLGRQMHEVLIETNTFKIRLICHDLRIDQLAVGDPWTGKLTPVDAD